MCKLALGEAGQNARRGTVATTGPTATMTATVVVGGTYVASLSLAGTMEREAVSVRDCRDGVAVTVARGPWVPMEVIGGDPDGVERAFVFDRLPEALIVRVGAVSSRMPKGVWDSLPDADAVTELVEACDDVADGEDETDGDAVAVGTRLGLAVADMLSDTVSLRVGRLFDADAEIVAMLSALLPDAVRDAEADSVTVPLRVPSVGVADGVPTVALTVPVPFAV